jgi:hypothetical protein
MNARTLIAWMLATSLPFVAACAGDLKDPERFSKLIKAQDAGQQADASSGTGHDSGVKGAPACVVQAFQSTCGTAACHAAGAQQVDLISNGVAGRLLDQPAKNAKCKGRTLVATDGSASLLVQKLSGTPPCGEAMPEGKTIAAKDKQCLFDWVVSVGGSVPDAGSP